jgi:hypothetical protein
LLPQQPDSGAGSKLTLNARKRRSEAATTARDMLIILLFIGTSPSLLVSKY